MEVDNSVISYLAFTLYNLQPMEESITQLCGYNDKNYSLVDANDNKKYVIKIVTNENDSREELTDIVDEIVDSLFDYCRKISEFTIPRLLRNSADKLSVRASTRQRNKEGDYSDLICNIKLFEYFSQSITLEDFVNNSKLNNGKPEDLYKRLGRICGRLFEFMRTQCHLKENLRQIRERDDFPWQLVTYEKRFRELKEKFYPNKRDEKRALLDITYDEFILIKNRLQSYPEHIIHGDLCGKNILVKLSDSSCRFCLIDFQDIQVGQQIVDLAIMTMYCILEQKSLRFNKALIDIPSWILSGYQENLHCKLSDEEINFIPTIMKVRLCQSLLNGEEALEAEPVNSDYVSESAKYGWHLLKAMTPHFKIAIRDKCLQ